MPGTGGRLGAGPRAGLHVSATFTSGAHQALGLDGGADGYLVEPVEPAVLRATIDAQLGAMAGRTASR